MSHVPQHCRPDAVLTTNTLGIPLTSIQAELPAEARHRLVGLRFCAYGTNPDALNPQSPIARAQVVQRLRFCATHLDLSRLVRYCLVVYTFTPSVAPSGATLGATQTH